MKKTYVNSKTGEIVELEEVCPFASLTDLKKDRIKDGEDYEPGTSVTTLEGYEPLESIVARCMRTVQSPNGTTYQVIDTDALKAEESGQGIYEASGATTLDEAFETLDPTQSQGFDLADASNIMSGINSKNNSSTASSAGEAPGRDSGSNIASLKSDLPTKGASGNPSNIEASDVVDKSIHDVTDEARAGSDKINQNYFPEKRKK